MYEEDRQTALAMYGRMFDETSNEEALLELLVSPTRQAVVLARSYDAKARKAQLESEQPDFADADSTPAFIFVIDKTAQQAAELEAPEAAPAEGQFSIFDESFELPEPDEAAFVQPLEAMETVEVVETAELVEEAAEDEAERSSVDETADALDAFLADFHIENGELVSVKAEEAAAEPQPESPAEAEESNAGDAPAEEHPAPDTVEEEPVRRRVKTNIFLLIIYIFLAIPVGIAGFAVLLLPTLFFLALAVSTAYLGMYLISTSFASFAVIADTMAVFGCGLAAAALALLFVWLFIWFLGVVIPGLIRGLCRLGRKICCKEVAVQ